MYNTYTRKNFILMIMSCLTFLWHAQPICFIAETEQKKVKRGRVAERGEDGYWQRGDSLKRRGAFQTILDTQSK